MHKNNIGSNENINKNQLKKVAFNFETKLICSDKHITIPLQSNNPFLKIYFDDSWTKVKIKIILINQTDFPLP